MARHRHQVEEAAEDARTDAPPWVITALAAGIVPAPLLFVYAGVFLLHGLFVPVEPPEIGDSRADVTVAGVVAVVALVVLIVTLLQLLNGSRRWPFLLAQAVAVALSVYSLVNPDVGARLVVVVLLFAALVAFGAALHPQSARWVSHS